VWGALDGLQIKSRIAIVFSWAREGHLAWNSEEAWLRMAPQNARASSESTSPSIIWALFNGCGVFSDARVRQAWHAVSVSRRHDI